MAVLLTRYLIQYHRVVSYFSEMEKTEDTELNNILDEICTDKEKRNIKIVQTAAVEVPCCIGIFEKRILIPDKKYSREELHYIILHEYTHLDNKDILTIQLINILCIVFWWNPFVYILKGDMYQSIEIRCDQTVTKKLKSAERGNYLTVILKEYKASVQEKEFFQYANHFAFPPRPDEIVRSDDPNDLQTTAWLLQVFEILFPAHLPYTLLISPSDSYPALPI